MRKTCINVNNIISPKLLRVIRAVLAVIIFYSVIMRSIYPWNNEIPPLCYFTIQSNLLCGLYWLWCAIFPKRKNKKVALAVTTYIAITGIVFIVFLDYGFLEKIYVKLGQNEITDV